MQPLDLSAARHLLAAEGFLELGLVDDAAAELSHLPPGQLADPVVLQIRWRIQVGRKDWNAALEVAGELLRAAPGDAGAWLHRAYALRRAVGGGLAQAFTALEPAAEKFPDEAVIPFNLACYSCQLGNLDDARKWFRRACDVGGRKHIKQMALGDEDLKPLWQEIGQL